MKICVARKLEVLELLRKERYLFSMFKTLVWMKVPLSSMKITIIFFINPDSDISHILSNSIPIHIARFRKNPVKAARPPPVRKTLRQNNLVLQSIELPTFMNLNPRSIYNKTEDFRVILEQYFWTVWRCQKAGSGKL